MIELTREDRVRINDAIDPFRTNSGSQMQEMIDAIYRAGMAAMAERAAQVCENTGLWTDGIGPDHCAAAIRALIKEQR